MICPKCKHNETKVIDSRDTGEGREIRRRRECEKCRYRFSTLEKLIKTNFVVVKRDGTREAYSRDKIERGIWRACEKRPVSQDQIEKMIDDLERQWAGLGKEVPSKVVGEGLMDQMKKLDSVAYIRFASVYRHFQDVESFKEEVARLLK